jgi:peptidoglycan-associated lipoprotein
MHRGRVAAPVVILTIAFTFGACAKSKPPVAKPVTPSSGGGAPSGTTGGAPKPPEPVAEPVGVPPEPPGIDPLKVSDIDKINQNSPFQPVFFAYDSSEIESEGQQVLTANAAILKKYPEWVITIEGHSDERGTAEYNLALGNRRASAAKAYLISLGIPADRLRTVSYGKEFPFDPTHTESGWSLNRRAHFVLTSK